MPSGKLPPSKPSPSDLGRRRNYFSKLSLHERCNERRQTHRSQIRNFPSGWTFVLILPPALFWLGPAYVAGSGSFEGTADETFSHVWRDRGGPAAASRCSGRRAAQPARSRSYRSAQPVVRKRHGAEYAGQLCLRTRFTVQPRRQGRYTVCRRETAKLEEYRQRFAIRRGLRKPASIEGERHGHTRRQRVPMPIGAKLLIVLIGEGEQRILARGHGSA